MALDAKRFSNTISKGFSFAQKNPQIIYTIFLVILIPIAFIYSGQAFLKVATSNQERLEKNRLSLMQDVFAEFIQNQPYDLDFLQHRITNIKSLNPSITQFKVVLFAPHNTILASLDTEEIGSEDTINKELYLRVGADKEHSYIFESFHNGARHLKAIRALIDTNQRITGFLFTETSMASIDQVSAQNIYQAYIILIILILGISLLLIRHARIIDYTVLYRQLKEVDAMKDDFISIASHELRAPLTAIKWQADSLPDDIKKNPTIASIQQSADDLGKLIEDILNVSRIEQGRIKMEPASIEPSDLITHVIDTLRQSASVKNIAIVYEKKKLPTIFVDPDRFKQVITNFLSNAIKYTLRGQIVIETYTENKNVYIKIRDTGIGMSAEEQKNLFQKFYRVKSKETREISGTGLGLWITRHIIQSMNGTVSVESIKGIGSSFTVSFPTSENK